MGALSGGIKGMGQDGHMILLPEGVQQGGGGGGSDGVEENEVILLVDVSDSEKNNVDARDDFIRSVIDVCGEGCKIGIVKFGYGCNYAVELTSDKESIFDALETAEMCLKVFTGMVSTMTACEDNMKKAAQGGFFNATDLADYLVKTGMPFRSAYKISGQLVAQCIREGTVLEELPLAAYKQFSELFEEDLYNDLDLLTCVEKRISLGGTSVASVEQQITYVKERI